VFALVEWQRKREEFMIVALWGKWKWKHKNSKDSNTCGVGLMVGACIYTCVFAMKDLTLLFVKFPFIFFSFFLYAMQTYLNFYWAICGLAGLFLCILPVYLGRFTLFLIKSSYLSKKKKKKKTVPSYKAKWNNEENLYAFTHLKGGFRDKNIHVNST